MSLDTLQLFILILINILSVILGAWVLKSSRKDKQNQWFVAMDLLIILWTNFSYIGSIARSYGISLLFYRLNDFVVSLFLFVFYYFFVSKFLKIKKNRLLNSIILIGSTFFALLSVFSDKIIASVKISDWGSEIIFGKLNDFLNAFAVFVAAVIFYFGIARYSKLPNKEKLRVRYFFLGIASFILANVVFNVIFPALFNTTRYQHFGDFSFIFFLAFTAYAIVKHRLMDIRMVVARSLAYAMLLVTIAGGYATTLVGVQNYFFAQREFSWEQTIFQIILAVIFAFTFQPLRRFFTKITDKIFFKNDYNFEVLLKKLTDNAFSTLILIELLYKTIDTLMKEMKVSRGFFVLLDEDGQIHTSQAIGYAKTPEFEPRDIKGFAKHEIIVFDDLEESSHFKTMFRRYDASIAIGLLDDNDKPVGALFLGEKNSGDMFNTKDIRLFEILAPEMVIAIQRAKEHEKVQNFNVYLQAEVNRKTKELQQANEHLRELDKAKDEFISMASHQLRTPLTAIKGYLSMLLEGDAGEIKMAQYDFINEAFDGANRMVALINDLLNVSRMDTGRFFLEPTKVDMEKLVDEEIKQLKNTAAEKKLYLKFEKKKAKIPPITADETKIRQVVMNFIDNAIYYTLSGGITVILDADKNNLIYKVADTGIGVPEGERKNLFSKFYRADNARKTRPDGTGLGIYLAKKVIEDHGGEVIFESKEGKGSTFGFKFPLKAKIKKELTIPPPDLAAKAKAEAEQATAPSGTPNASDKQESAESSQNQEAEGQIKSGIF